MKDLIYWIYASNSHLNFRLSDGFPMCPHAINYWFRGQGSWKAFTQSSCLTKIQHLRCPWKSSCFFCICFGSRHRCKRVVSLCIYYLSGFPSGKGLFLLPCLQTTKLSWIFLQWLGAALQCKYSILFSLMALKVRMRTLSGCGPSAGIAISFALCGFLVQIPVSSVVKCKGCVW